MATESTDAQPTASFSIKNTFIDVDDVTDDGFMDVSTRGPRQFSEPVRPHRALSSVGQDALAAETRLVALPEPTEVSEPEDEPHDIQFNHGRGPTSLPLSSTDGAVVDMTNDWKEEEGYAAATQPWINGQGDAAAAQHWQSWQATGLQTSPTCDQVVISEVAAMMGKVAVNPVVQSYGKSPPGWEDTTTVMMRNIPNKYSQGMMLTELNETGFLGLYDFFYLPMDPETCANRGYAFINFIDSGAAWLFKTTYEGRKMKMFNSTKHVSVTPATLQGFDANYAHYSSSRVSRGDPAARPLFLRAPSAAVPRDRRGRARRGKYSAVDAVNQQQFVLPNSAEQLQQTAVAAAVMAGTNVERSQAALDAMAAAASAAALANNTAESMTRHAVPKPQGKTSGLGQIPKFCPFCGGNTQQSFRFCQYCGANLERYMSGSGDQINAEIEPRRVDFGLSHLGF